jgi:cell division protein FtsL
MNRSNLFLVIAALTLATFFLGSVFLNLHIKERKHELQEIKTSIKEIKIAIKRQKIEVTALTSPTVVLEYIEKNDMKPVTLENVTVIKVNDSTK